MSVFRFGAAHSPPRRPTVQGSEQSPFCTSPSQLLDLTLDPNMNSTIPFSMGIRSPGKTSPIRGRTMKEYEEQLSHLKKENFNLKLRIYFLEERTGHMSGADSKEDIMKTNIELKVELETLRKELTDKQELLCQAAKALELMEEQHHNQVMQVESDRELEKGMLDARIQELEKELKLLAEKQPPEPCVNHHSVEEVQQLQQHIESLETQVNQLECSLQEENERTNQLESDLQDAQQGTERVNVRCQSLELQLRQRDNRLEDMMQELEQREQDLAGTNLRIRTLEEALSSKEPEIQIKVQELCERDRIIEEKQSRIEQQNKVLVEIQITLDEKQRQIEALRSSLADRDTSIATLETRLAVAKANARSYETKLDASQHEAARLRGELETLKAQQKRNIRSREPVEVDHLLPSRRRSNNSLSSVDERTSPVRRIRTSHENVTLRKQNTSEQKEKEDKSKNRGEKDREGSASIQKYQNDLIGKEREMLELKEQVVEVGKKLQESEEKSKQNAARVTEMELHQKKSLQTIQTFTKMCKELTRDSEHLKVELKKRERRISDLTSELGELREACNKANWECRQFQAQSRVQAGGALNDVQDMTEEENERLWAEVEDKNKKLLQLTEERDGISIEMEKQVQSLLKSLKEKEAQLEEFENKLSASANNIFERDNHIVELEQELSTLKTALKQLQGSKKNHCTEQSSQTECESKSELTSLIDSIGTRADNVLSLELQDKKREIERLNGELRKRTINLQELVNKELWDKNREIEKLQDRLNILCERKELEIISLQQQVGARDFQLKVLQDKVTELGLQVNLPSALVIRELQPVTFNQHVHIQQLSNSSEEQKVEAEEVSRESLNTPTPSLASIPVLKEEVLSLREEKKYLCHKVEELKERMRNTPERDCDSRVIMSLRSECAKAREDAERAEAWRKEAGEVCGMLTRRLEELSTFLCSLLKRREFLGGLGARRQQMLRKVVENSMELSRTLSMSFCDTQDPSTSILQMSSLSGLLMSSSGTNLSLLEMLGQQEEDETSSCDLIQKDNARSPETTLTPNSHCCRSSESSGELGVCEKILDNDLTSKDKVIAEQVQVIKRLRSQVELLLQENKQRDIELSLANLENNNCTSKTENTLNKVTVDQIENKMEETHHSFLSMTFYNSHHLDTKSNEQWCNVEHAIPCLEEGKRILDEITCRQGTEQRHRCGSLPKASPVKTEDVILRTSVSAQSSPVKPNSFGNSGVRTNGSHKIRRSSSANAVITNQQFSSNLQRECGIASLSESEAWSEPDRNVSLARIGLQEENAKTILSSMASTSVVGSSVRTRGARVKELDQTSESSEETAHEISRSSGKRGRGDTADLRRLQGKIRGLEQVNDALRVELNILHQLAPSAGSPKSIEHRPSTRDISVNTSLAVSKTKLDKATSVEHLKDEGPSITVPANLLEQIRYQREKLESSLFHNDFIRQQLEGIFVSLSDTKGEDVVHLCQKLKESSEELCAVRSRGQELEARLQEVEGQLEQNKNRAEQLITTVEQLQASRKAVLLLQEQIGDLETKLKEKDNELLELHCSILELGNKLEEQRIETNGLRDEAARQVQEAELLLEDSESRLKEGEMQIKLLESKVHDLEKQKDSLRNESSEKVKKIEMEIYNAEKRRNEAEIQVIEVKKQLQEEGNRRYEVEWKLQAVEEKVKVKEGEFEKQYHELLERRIKEIELRASIQLHDAEKKLEQREWVHKAEAEKKVQEAERLGSEFEAGLKRQIEEAEKQGKSIRAEAEKKIKELEDRYKAREADLKKKVQESERRLWEKDSELCQQLDESAMKLSQAALDRTRLVNEKLHLEQEVCKHVAQATDLTNKQSEVENCLQVAKDRLNGQVMELEQKRSELERRVRELEYENSELEQRLAKLHMTDSLHSEQSSGHVSGPQSTSSLPLRKPDADSLSSGLDMYSGDGGSLPSSPWSFPAGGLDDRSRKEDSIRRDNSTGGMSALSNLVLQHGFNRQHSEMSDYMSEEQPVEEYEAVFTQTCSSSYWVTLTNQHSTNSSGGPIDHIVGRNVNSSPDLGIESDQGRFSSLEASTLSPPSIQLETTHYTGNRIENGNDVDGIVSAVLNSRNGVNRDFFKLQHENAELKRDLSRTRRSLEATLAQLTSSNQMKRQMERAICKQLHKTHHILKQARENLEGDTTSIATVSGKD